MGGKTVLADERADLLQGQCLIKLAAVGAVLFSGAATAGYGSRSELVGLSDSSHS